MTVQSLLDMHIAFSDFDSAQQFCAEKNAKRLEDKQPLLKSRKFSVRVYDSVLEFQQCQEENERNAKEQEIREIRELMEKMTLAELRTALRAIRNSAS